MQLLYFLCIIPAIGCVCMVIVFPSICMQSMSMTNKLISYISAGEDMYSIQPYVRKFASVLRQISRFLLVLLFPGAIKLSATILLKYICTCVIESGVYTALLWFKSAVIIHYTPPNIWQDQIRGHIQILSNAWPSNENEAAKFLTARFKLLLLH